MVSNSDPRIQLTNLNCSIVTSRWSILIREFAEDR